MKVKTVMRVMRVMRVKTVVRIRCSPTGSLPVPAELQNLK